MVNKTPETTKTTFKLVHIAFLEGCGPPRKYLFLRLIDYRFVWLERHDDGTETETTVAASNVEEAMRLAYRRWRFDGFRPLGCGFRYTLPERDEHGGNALFFQMAASLSSMNGVYFDEEVGHNCFVQGYSLEARDLWEKIKKENKL